LLLISERKVDWDVLFLSGLLSMHLHFKANKGQQSVASILEGYPDGGNMQIHPLTGKDTH
jgi:hypothetical protein